MGKPHNLVTIPGISVGVYQDELNLNLNVDLGFSNINDQDFTN